MKRILIVEDDPTIAQVEKDYLELSGFEVVVENTGTGGLKRSLNEEFDLVILDLMLPGVDGFEICKSIRETKNIPIIMISARNEEIAKMRGFELGLDDYLTKPFSPNELVARVKGRLTRYESLVNDSNDASKTIEDNGMLVDIDSRRVFINGDEVVLTVKEFDMLVLLASNPNKVFSKEDMFEKIWDLSSEGDISTVTVHVRRLREKIEYESSNPKRIITVWGLGYKYVK